jgi:hypothetical protein
MQTKTPKGRRTERVFFGEELAQRLHVAVVVLDHLRVVVDQVGGFLGVAHRFEAAFADLEAHHGRDLVLARADGLRGLAHRLDPLLPRQGAPLLLQAARGLHRQAHVFCRRGLKLSKNERRVYR